MWPNVGLLVVFLLIIPASILLFMPLDVRVGFVVGPVVYLVIIGIISFSTPKIRVSDGEFSAGVARIPVALLGEITELDRTALSLQLGTRADARAHLVIRGWIHTALRINVADPNDPTPYWVVTTRRPADLRRAIESERDRHSRQAPTG